MLFRHMLSPYKLHLELFLNSRLREWPMVLTDCDLTQLVWLTDEVSCLEIGMPMATKLHLVVQL